MRLPLTSRDAVLIILALIALGVGGAGLGLALANRLSGDDPDAIERRVGIVRACPSSDVRPGFDLPPIRIEGVPDVRDVLDRVASEARLRTIVHGEVLEIDRDSILVETSDGERRRIHGTRRVSETLDVGETVDLPVQLDRHGRLRLSDAARSSASRGVDVVAERGTVIAIGEVTHLSNDSLGVATIRGNDVDIAILDPDQTDGLEVGDAVLVVAERTDDGFVARWLRELVGPTDFRAATRLLPAFAG